ncbi:putative MFS family arabinose efflux permease [Rhodococcus sp. AG1013]|uniref:MFS transporter n=1 Tax=Rhodococcus sp. AG1013 TaxID=2183996 RepID=UPI000E0C8FC0|nr:MFS transporter [Rhodococcus sp. AG1013]RDI30357.1 putative MFS family arabinose efflux permease [Rhodococcus sp. AG1013]
MKNTVAGETVAGATNPRDDRPTRGSREYRAITLALFAAGLTTFVSMYSAQALLPALTDDFGVAPAVAALAVSVTTGMVAVAIIPASVLSERFGRTRVMVTSAAVSSVLGVLVPLSPSIEVLLVGRAVQGMALAGIPAVAMAYLAEEVGSRDLGSAMGRYIAGTTIGGLVGRLVPSAVLGVASWRWAMEAASVLALVLAVVMTRKLPPSRNFRPQRVHPRIVLANLAGHLRNPALATLFSLGFLLMGGFVSAYNFLGFRLLAEPFSLPEALVGLVFLMYLAGTYTSAAAGAAADRFGRATVLLGAVAVMAAGLVITLTPLLPLVLLGMLLFTGGFFAAHSVASGWVGLLATEHRAEASSMYLFSYYLGSSVAGAAAGVAYAWGGWPATVGFVGVLLVIAVAGASGMFRQSRPGPGRRVRASAGGPGRREHRDGSDE